MHTVDVTRMQLYYDSAKKFLDRMRRISKPIEIGRLKPEIEDYSDTVLLIHNLFYSLDKKMITAMTEYKNNNVDTFVELRTEADTIRKRIRQISLRLRDRRWQYNVNDYTDSLCIHLGNIIDSGSIGRKYLRRHLKYYQFYLTALEECYYRYEYESKRDYKDYASSRVLSSFINEADSCLRLVNKVKLNIPSTKDHLIRLQNKRADLEKQWRVRN